MLSLLMKRWKVLELRLWAVNDIKVSHAHFEFNFDGNNVIAAVFSLQKQARGLVRLQHL